MKIPKNEILSKIAVLNLIVNEKTVRSEKIFWAKAGLCSCPDCDKHHVWGKGHPIYKACMFCFSPYERSLFSNVWESWFRFGQLKRCDQEVIEKLKVENVVLKRVKKVRPSIEVQSQIDKVNQILRSKGL